MLSHQAARAKVIEVVSARAAAAPRTETIEFAADPSRALGRILAENPLTARRATDLPSALPMPPIRAVGFA
jgi:hypothetical protein